MSTLKTPDNATLPEPIVSPGREFRRLRGSHNRVVFDWRTVGASDSTLLRFLGGVDGRWFLRRYSSFSSI
jgi:hypothetical protein